MSATNAGVPFRLLLLCDRQQVAARVDAIAASACVPLEHVDRTAAAAAAGPETVLLVDTPFAGALGSGTIAALRCDPRCADLPILAVVDDADDATARDVLGAGADDFLRVGCLERDLLVRVSAQRRAWQVRQELRMRELDLRLLVDLTRDFAGTLDAGQLLHGVTSRLAQALDLRRCSLVLTDASGKRGTVVATSDDRAVARRSIDLDKYPEIREALRTRKAVVLADAGRHPLLDPVKEAVSAAGLGAIAVLPLALENEILGVLFLRGPAAEAARAFSLRELDFAAAVANATAVALRNARSVEEIRSRVVRVEAQADALRQYEAIYEHVSDGIALVDAVQGDIRAANPAALAILGLDAEAVRGRRLREVLAEEGDALERIRDAAAGEVVRGVALEARRNDGATVLLEVGAAPLDSSLVILSLRDVTERKRMEAELHATRQQLEAAARQAMIVELAGAAAHELNQPLTSVLGYAELLQRRLQPGDPTQRSIGIILREAERMAEVVRKIGRLTRHETKPYVGNARIVDLERAGGE